MAVKLVIFFGGIFGGAKDSGSGKQAPIAICPFKLTATKMAILSLLKITG